jgi:hypothetical protein
MDNEISLEYINKAIDELVAIWGVKTPLSTLDFKVQFGKKSPKEVIEFISSYFYLPVKIYLNIVPNGNNNNAFSGVAAEVSIPGNLPMYGSPELIDFKINVRVKEGSLKYPIPFATIMAHEFCHVLLHSYGHPKKDSEIYTDLLVMLLGFQDIFRLGRRDKTVSNYGSKTVTHTSNIGYLNDTQFNYAYRKISNLLKDFEKEKAKVYDDINSAKDILKDFNRRLKIFQEYLKYHSQNINKKITGEDGYKIVSFFQLGYTDRYNLLVRDFENEIERVESFLEDYNEYKPLKNDNFKDQKYDFKISVSKFKEKRFILGKDLRLVEKYINLFNRWKIFIRFKLGEKRDQ